MTPRIFARGKITPFLFLVLLSGGMQNGAAQTDLSSAGNAAGVFSDADAGFKAKMHGKPEHNVTKTGEGSDDVQHQYLVAAANGVFMVAYQDHPEINAGDPAVIEKLYTSARDGFKKAVGGEQVEYKTITHSGLSGRETRFRIPSRQGAAITRMFFANQRWYHVFVLGAADFVNSKTAQQFLDSFQVIGSRSSQKSSREDLIRKHTDF
ncbi:MAG: hypothetical protein R3C59_05180 [Planctomycetaceae bacterium]